MASLGRDLLRGLAIKVGPFLLFLPIMSTG